MSLKKVLLAALIWQVAIIVFSLISPSIWPLRIGYLGQGFKTYLNAPLLYSRANFDGNHYLQIATHGYTFPQTAFFPAFPLVIRFLSHFTSPLSSGLIVSQVSFLLSLIVLVKLVRLDHSSTVSRWTITSLLFFPVSFFFSFVYTESLFFLFVVLSFFFARKKSWFYAGIFGLLATLTRLVGIALFPALLYELLTNSKRFRFREYSALLLIPLGLLIYMWFLYRTTGDALSFLHVQSLFNQGRSDHLVLIYQVIWRYVKMLFTVNMADPLYLTIVMEFFSSLLFIFLTFLSLFKQRFSYFIFSAVCIFLPPTTGSFTSMGRYGLVAFPLFILFGQLLSTSKKLPKTLILFSFSILFCLYLTMFVRGYWVA